ncbi:MAG TPA: hypothetical protein VGN86_07135 [Pyrinomonadaceae bacterium]|nr:hypothetical protein [Pyrinomonadaceae bacterium]
METKRRLLQHHLSLFVPQIEVQAVRQKETDMRSLSQRIPHVGTAVLIGMMFVLVATLLPAAEKPESTEVAQMLQEAKEHAAELARDADELESLTRSDVTWQSHAEKLEQIKEHVNAMGRLVPKLIASRDSASPWQQQAIDRMVPLLQELAANTSAAIQHLNQNRVRPTGGPYTDYLKENAETAHELSDMISSFWRYGQTRAKLEHLEQRLEIASK